MAKRTVSSATVQPVTAAPKTARAKKKRVRKLGSDCVYEVSYEEVPHSPEPNSPEFWAADDERRRAPFPKAVPEDYFDTKDTNPKDAVGTLKVPCSTVPAQVWGQVALAFLEGARKYGRHNYRIAGVRASVYYDAVWRHLGAWWEGEDIDPESGLPHVVKAIASLTVLQDSCNLGNWVDDRPPALEAGWVQELNQKAAEIIARAPDAKPAFTEIDRLNQKVFDEPPL